MTWSCEVEPPPLKECLVREVLTQPIPERSLGDQVLLRVINLLGHREVRVIEGLEHISVRNDPFILALNHSTCREALLIPALLILHRGGRLIHFLADWNYRLIPGIGLIYRRAETITVTRKSARPAFLNIFKLLYRDPDNVVARAQACLLAGRSIGIFPEGRVNRDERRLLKGRIGAAYLSLTTGAPIIPAGIRIRPRLGGAGGWWDPLELRIGAPLHPPALRHQKVGTAQLRAWHAVVMTAISDMSGKEWAYGGGEVSCETIRSARAA